MRVSDPYRIHKYALHTVGNLDLPAIAPGLENGSFLTAILPEIRITFSPLFLPVRNMLDGVSTAANMFLILV